MASCGVGVGICAVLAAGGCTAGCIAGMGIGAVVGIAASSAAGTIPSALIVMVQN